MDAASTVSPQCPQDYQVLPMITHMSLEEMTAWTITERIDRWLHVYKREGIRTNGVETWALGPPNSDQARLSSWFEDEKPGTSYRIFIHRRMRKLRKNRQDQLEDRVTPFGYEMLRAGYHKRLGLSRVRRREARKKLENVAVPFLRQMLVAYSKDHSSIEQLMRESGHPFVYSNGARSDKSSLSP